MELTHASPSSTNMMPHTDDQYSLLVCNGELAAPDVVRQLASRADSIVCADGGANAMHELGILPDTVIGDFDSIRDDVQQSLSERGVELLHLTRQDDTDLEKALMLLRDRSVPRVIVLGATGKQLDHSFGNFSILKRYIDRMHIVLFDSAFRVDFVRSGASYRGRAGDRVSLVPFPRAEEVTYTGLRYPLDAATLELGEREGTCNEALGEAFDVSLRAGTLLLFRSLHAELYLHPFLD
ncbi:thiamine diphosphokinase [bacterium]|nr:thiamine diphosphokinase [bacterium]